MANGYLLSRDQEESRVDGTPDPRDTAGHRGTPDPRLLATPAITTLLHFSMHFLGYGTHVTFLMILY